MKTPKLKGGKPVRIQRSRQHKMVSPNGLPIVYVGRPSKWGNPFKVGDIDEHKTLISKKRILFTSKKAVEKYEMYLSMGAFTIGKIKELKGKNLACWCPLDQPCHADILLKIANSV